MIKRLSTFAAATLALAACQSPEEGPAPVPDGSPPTSTAASPSTASSPTSSASEEVQAGAIVSAEELVGEYRIPGADGQDINLPHGISAIIDRGTIRVSADCLNFAWTYRFEGPRLVTEGTPVASCRRGLLPEEEAVRAAFDAADTVRRLPSNGIEFSGGGRSVLLFSQ